MQSKPPSQQAFTCSVSSLLTFSHLFIVILLLTATVSIIDVRQVNVAGKPSSWKPTRNRNTFKQRV